MHRGRPVVAEWVSSLHGGVSEKLGHIGGVHHRTMGNFVFSFYTSWKHQKPKFLLFSEDTKREY